MEGLGFRVRPAMNRGNMGVILEKYRGHIGIMEKHGNHSSSEPLVFQGLNVRIPTITPDHPGEGVYSSRVYSLSLTSYNLTLKPKSQHLSPNPRFTGMPRAPPSPMLQAMAAPTRLHHFFEAGKG